jgi:hypothetical protein
VTNVALVTQLPAGIASFGEFGRAIATFRASAAKG